MESSTNNDYLVRNPAVEDGHAPVVDEHARVQDRLIDEQPCFRPRLSMRIAPAMIDKGEVECEDGEHTQWIAHQGPSLQFGICSIELV